MSDAKINTMLLLGFALVILHFISEAGKLSDTAADNFAKWYEKPAQDEAKSGLLYSQNKLIMSVQRAILRGDNIPSDIMSKYKSIIKER